MKVEIKIGQDNERGLFACDDIKKGEMVCILPIDYFQLDNNWYTFTEQSNKINFRYGIICEIVKNGITQYESFSSFFKKRNKRHKCIFKQLQSATNKKNIQIIGVSNPTKTESNFLGHMINDYVDMTFLSEINYDRMSTEFSNVKVSPKLKMFDNRLGLKITASKEIKKGEELYLSYGSDYWKQYSGKKSFVYAMKLRTM